MDYTSVEYFHQACRNIVDNEDCKAVNYAVYRAQSGLLERDPKNLKTRALYLISNITHWRGSIANETRSILKNIIKYAD